MISSRQAEAFARLEACQGVLLEQMLANLSQGGLSCRDLKELASAMSMACRTLFMLYDRPTIDQQLGRERLDLMRESVRLEEQKLRQDTGGADKVEWIIHMTDE